MTYVMRIAAIVAGAAVLASTATAAVTAGMSVRGTAAYGATLQAEAAAYGQAISEMTPVGFRAYGATLQAEARWYRAIRAIETVPVSRGFSWTDAGIGAAGALALVLMSALLLRVRVRRAFVPAPR